MKVNCPGCATEFTLDPKKVPSEGVRARCSVCNAVITVPPPDAGEGLGVKGEGTLNPPPVTPHPSPVTPSIPAPLPITETIPVVQPPQAAAVKRPTNPFLTKDPDQRAKRLARALVSDIITYYPAKHSEGMRDGTLKTLFKDEIKKSYEEYVEQVGREYADSTPYFQEALNDVLAGGKKIF